MEYALAQSKPEKQMNDYKYKIVQCTSCGKIAVTESNRRHICPLCRHTFELRVKGHFNCRIRFSNDPKNAIEYAKHWEECLHKGIKDMKSIDEKWQKTQ